METNKLTDQQREQHLRVTGWKQDDQGLWYTEDRPHLKMGLLSAFYTQLRTDGNPYIRLNK